VVPSVACTAHIVSAPTSSLINCSIHTVGTNTIVLCRGGGCWVAPAGYNFTCWLQFHLLATPSRWLCWQHRVGTSKPTGPAHAGHMQAEMNPPLPCKTHTGLVSPLTHLSEGTVLEKNGMPLSCGLLEAGLMRGTCAAAATPAAATVAPEQMSPMTATAGQHTPGAGGRTYRSGGGGEHESAVWTHTYTNCSWCWSAVCVACSEKTRATAWFIYLQGAYA
jgi:hypothetical protein